MKLKIDENTTFVSVSQFADTMLKDPTFVREVWEYFFGCDFWRMTIDDFCDMAQGDSDKIKVLAFNNGELTAFGWVLLQSFKSQAEDLIKVGERLTIKGENTGDVTEAEKLTTFEAMAFFVREYFGLRSFAEAAQVSVGDWLLAKKHTYCKAMSEKRATDAMRKKLNKKR